MTKKTLRIVWQRLTDAEGRTCDRCGSTYTQLKQALARLTEVLRPLNIEPVLVIREIDGASFAADPLQSNRIWIGDKPLEKWLDARIASTPCCSVCGDAECRTIEVAGQVFEAIPSALIVRAALRAASDLIETHARDSGGHHPCCD